MKITEKEWSDIESSWERGFSCLCWRPLHLPSYLFRGKNRMEISIYLYFGEKIEINRVLKTSLYEIRKFQNMIYLSISYAQSMRCNTFLPLSLWSCSGKVEVTVSLKFQSGNIWRLRFIIILYVYIYIYIYIFFFFLLWISGFFFLETRLVKVSLPDTPCEILKT